MQDVLIIGNGFDLYHKLPTRYTDFLFLVRKWSVFYEGYVNNTKNNPYDRNSQQIVARVDEYGNLTEDALEDFAQHASVLNPDRIKRLSEIIEKNVWTNYFIHSGYEKDGWIDFEAEIENVLVNIESFFSTEIFKSEGKLLSQAINPACFKVVKLMMDYTEALPLNIGIYSRMMIQDIVYGDVKERLLEELRLSLEDLIEALNIYLGEFVGSIKVPVYSEQIKRLGSVNLLNFNYTYTFKTVYGGNHLNKHHQIHGSLQEEDIVLGISDDTFDNLEYVYFQKYFQRIQKKTGAFYREWIPSFSALEDAPIDVYIMGHSLGKTDKDVLSEFFMNEKAVKKITVFYHNQKEYENLVISLIDLYGKGFVIDQTGKGRIEFLELKEAVEGSAK